MTLELRPGRSRMVGETKRRPAPKNRPAGLPECRYLARTVEIDATYLDMILQRHYTQESETCDVT